MNGTRNLRVCSRHTSAGAVAYCNTCNIFLCQNCENSHRSVFGDTHNTTPAYSAASPNPQRGGCPTHINYLIDSLCSNCMELCCTACMWDGKHKGHNIISLGRANNLLKTNIESDIKTLESGGRILQGIQQKALKELEKIQWKKNEAKEFIRQQFNEIRNMIEENEIRMLSNVNEAQLDEVNFSKCIMEAQSMFASLSSTHQKAKSILNYLNNKEITTNVACEIISITKETECSYNNIREKETTVDSTEFEKVMKTIVQSINTIKEAIMISLSTLGPKSLTVKTIGSFFVSLEWDRNDDNEKYTIAIHKEGTEWDPKSSLECIDNKVIIPFLEQETTYKFRVMAKRGTFTSRWSDPLEVKTLSSTVENFTSALANHCDDINICTNALESMNILLKESENKVKAGQCGAINVIVNAMKTHINNADVCYQGCADNQVKAGQYEVIDAIVNAMNKHTSNAAICEKGCGALMNITFNADNQVKAGQCGAIDAIVNAMKTHINNSGVCYRACGALWNITEVADNKVNAGKTEAIDVIVNIMKAHVNDGVCYRGCGSLASIIMNNADNQVKAGQCGAIDVVLNVMKIHINNADVCEQGCWTLWNITDNADNKLKAGQCGAIDVVLDAMKTHINSSIHVCYRGCGALMNIVLNNDENAYKLKGSNASEVIKIIQLKYPNLSSTTKSILSIINN